MNALPDKAQALAARMLKLPLYAIFWEKTAGSDLNPLLADHLEYLMTVESQGRLFASGPMGSREKGAGLTVVRAPDEAAAREIADADPLFKAGLRTYTVQSWTVMEGTITIKVNFSTGTAVVT